MNENRVQITEKKVIKQGRQNNLTDKRLQTEHNYFAELKAENKEWYQNKTKLNLTIGFLEEQVFFISELEF